MPSTPGLRAVLQRVAVRTALGLVVVVALAVGSFLAYGAWTRGRPTTYARGGGFGGAPLVTTGPVSGGASASPSPYPSSTPGSASPSTSPVPGPARTTAPAPVEQSAAPVPTPRAAGSVVQPAVGTYQLDVQGSEKVSFGPLSACSNTFPTSSTLVVQHATGEPAGSYDFDQRYYPDSPNRHDERHIYSYGQASVLLTYEQATVTCSGVKQSSTVSYGPAQLRVQLPLRVGATWHSTGGDSSRTEDATGKVTGTEQVVVGGQSFLTYVIATHVTMSGSESGTRDQTWWWSPALGLPLRWHETLAGSRSGASYSADTTCTVTELPRA